MSAHAKTLLVINAEAAIERPLVEDIKRLSAHGYTVLDARGAGSRGERNAQWEADRSIQIQVICEKDVADALSEHIRKTYFDHYAVTLFTSDVEVLRSGKF